MKLTVLSSGSHANGYLLTAANGETLIIEAGVRLDKLEKAMNWDFSSIVGCIVSHEHMDHAQWIKQYVEAGITCYCNQETWMRWGIPNSGHLSSEAQIQLGRFKVKPLEVAHDVPCLAFLIDHPEMGRMFFITDSSYCKWNLSGAKINNWLVECNYSFEILARNMGENKIDKQRYQRVLEGHFGLDNCKDFLLANDLSHTLRIVLLHASRQNGNTVLFKKEIEDATGKNVYLAKEGLVIESFGANPF